MDVATALRTAAGTALTVREMVAIGFRHRFKVLAALLLPQLLVAAMLIVLPPKYRASSDLMVKTGREYLAQSDGDAGLTAPTSTKQEGINSEISLLTSRAVVEAAINAIGIQTLYPSLITSPPWFKSVLDGAVDKFHKDLTVEPVKLSNVIAVSFDAGTPDKAKMVLDRLIGIYIDKHTQVFSASRSESYADAIARDVAQATTLEQHLTQVKLDTGIYDISAQRAALISQRVAAEAHLQDVVNQQAMLTGRLRYLNQELPKTPAVLRSTGTDRNDAVDHARQTLIDLRASEAAMAARYAPGNPDLQRVRGQIASLGPAAAGGDRVNVTTTPSPLVQQMKTEIVMGQAQLVPLTAEQRRYETLVGSLGDELHRLEAGDLELRTTASRIDALNDNLKLVQTRYDQARTQEQMDIAKQVSVVQVAPAIAPDRAAKPNKPMFIAGSFLLGVFAACGIVVLAVLTSSTIVTEDGLEGLLGLPVLLTLPVARKRVGPATLALE
jgi:uncharacterized protein involved in exopolysaccharide biosynthesis